MQMHNQEEHQLQHGLSLPEKQLNIYPTQVLSLLEGPGALDPGVTSDCLDWVASHLAEVRGQPGWTEMLQKPDLAAHLLEKM